MQVFVFLYPVSERQEADKARNGCHHFYDHPGDFDRRLRSLHTQQPLLQRVLVGNSLKNKKSLVSRPEDAKTTAFYWQKMSINDSWLTALLNSISVLYIVSCKEITVIMNCQWCCKNTFMLYLPFEHFNDKIKSNSSWFFLEFCS